MGAPEMVPDEVVRASAQDASQTCPRGGDSGMSGPEDTPRQTQVVLSCLAWDCLGLLPEGLLWMAGERVVWVNPEKWKKPKIKMLKTSCF